MVEFLFGFTLGFLASPAIIRVCRKTFPSRKESRLCKVIKLVREEK